MNRHIHQDIRVTDIPWSRLTTSYGRGTELPRLIQERDYAELANLIEHQSTLWQVTPWTLLLLLRELKLKQAEDVTLAEVELYLSVTDAFIGRDMADVPHVENPLDLLNEAYLWPESEEDDELLWEEEEPPGYEELPFSSYYYFSYLALQEARPDIEKLSRQGEIGEAVNELLERLKP